MQDDWKLAGCSGKEAFDSYAMAERVSGLRRKNRKGKLFVYKCSFCSKFHLSGIRKKKRMKCV